MERAQIGNEINVGYATHEGMSGKHNEDFFGMFAWKLDDQRKFYLGVVADGVGGQSAGEVASRLTVGAIQNYFDQQSLIENNVSAHLERAIQVANETVYKGSQENPEQRGMSTTVALVAFINNRMYTAYVGDSRIYLMRDGRLRQISIDHTWAQEAIEAGLLTPEQAKTHPNRNVIRRHLGGGPKVQVDHRLATEAGQSAQAAQANQGLALRASDTVLICSDGLTDMISDGAVHESLQRHFFDLPTGAQELIDKANRAGGRDNITLVIMQVPGEAQPLVAAPAAGATAVAAAAPAVAAQAPPAAQGPVMAPAPAQKKGGRGVVWLIIGGAVILFLLALAAGLIFVISGSLGGDPTPETPALGTLPPGVTLPPGAPATAAILATAGALGTPGLDGSGLEEPELIPTLRSTLTETPVPRATATRTPLTTPTPTPTRVTSSGGGPRPTATPRPTNTPTPRPTATPTTAPPTATNTTQPPTATNTTAPTATNTTQPPTATNTTAPPPPTNTTEPPPPPTNTTEPPPPDETPSSVASNEIRR